MGLSISIECVSSLRIPVPTDDALHLLATCYYRSGKVHQAYDVLRERGTKTPQTKFLMAKCCQELKRIPEAEAVLTGGDSLDPKKENSPEEMNSEFGDSASFALQLLASIYSSTERSAKANDCDQKALKLNPFLWKSFEALCNRGVYPDPAKTFTVTGLDSLKHCHGINAILSLVNSNMSSAANVSGSPNNSLPNITVTSTPNPVLQTPQQLSTPANNSDYMTPDNNQQTPMDTSTTNVTPLNKMTTTPLSNTSVNSSAGGVGGRVMVSGIGTLNYSTDSDMPLTTQRNNSLMPPPLRRRPRQPQQQKQQQNQSPCSNLIQKYSLDDSFDTPSFGLLPRFVSAATTKSDLGAVRLRLDMSSPTLSVLSPCITETNESPVKGNSDKANNRPKRVSATEDFQCEESHSCFLLRRL